MEAGINTTAARIALKTLEEVWKKLQFRRHVYPLTSGGRTENLCFSLLWRAVFVHFPQTMNLTHNLVKNSQ